MILAGKTFVGRRNNNEDSFCVSNTPTLSFTAVSDGMGGHAAGETASRICIETLSSILLQSNDPVSAGTLQSAFQQANASVLKEASENDSLSGMGATLVCAVLFPNEFLAANVGDSRLYLYHDGVIRQVSHDHSYVEELVRRNLITSAEAKTHPRRNIITRAIGVESKLKVDLFQCEWEKDDILLLCSDGLTGVMDDSDIASFLSAKNDLDSICSDLIQQAYDLGSSDNITVVLAKNAEDEL